MLADEKPFCGGTFSTPTGDYTQNPAQGHDECNREWVLKKSIFFKTAKIWGMEMSGKTEKVVCRASYCKVFSTIFR
jgi:hypothetical protein